MKGLYLLDKKDFFGFFSNILSFHAPFFRSQSLLTKSVFILFTSSFTYAFAIWIFHFFCSLHTVWFILSFIGQIIYSSDRGLFCPHTFILSIFPIMGSYVSYADDSAPLTHWHRY
jgi:hypothetical protein